MARAKDGPAGYQHNVTYRAEGGALTRGFGVIQGTADDQVKVPTGAAQRCAGVVSESVSAAGMAVNLTQLGETIAIAGGAVNASDFVKMDANGKFVAANAADVETAGRARTSAAADLDEFVLFVMPNQKRS